ncbi:MAG: hypothetical protein PHF46_02580 [Candidatus Gracilibacteria bacterium]|nr:hypothetical protein [Candidatus Gracilibacteria bacterium]MDD3120268.1 hypothetical protein [Candidatus Gracilibacteria bacterium]MDD4530279.1 hypothetical protein [Candidatus Gracilibacteria bacterium]
MAPEIIVGRTDAERILYNFSENTNLFNLKEAFNFYGFVFCCTLISSRVIRSTCILRL